MHPGQTFQTVGIISRPRRQHLSVVVPPLLKWLEARGVSAVYDEETANSLPDTSKGRTRQLVADSSQLLLVLGGAVMAVQLEAGNLDDDHAGATTAAATVSASTCSRTSCARMIVAPRS